MTGPVAKGWIKLTERDDGNYGVKVQVRYLADPGQWRTGADSYVVWIRPSGPHEHTLNLGTLQPYSRFRAEMRAITPLSNFEIFVTPELNRNAREPSGAMLLSAQVTP
jgi:hypothetical protein